MAATWKLVILDPKLAALWIFIIVIISLLTKLPWLGDIRDVSFFQLSFHLPTCLPYTEEALQFTLFLLNVREAVNINWI